MEKIDNLEYGNILVRIPKNSKKITFVCEIEENGEVLSVEYVYDKDKIDNLLELQAFEEWSRKLP